ncbi:arginine N-succinyltransferase [Spartinivicinus poritis]|uniref:Arginine N-succinyltransferase n=1 Tax=Spartinivicinus poritis TaxID=2994640 RepID=A0ABT5UED1_9GAMM|nr:arginine N-succinyltransferase [Spartinivicinus sp. A2-2]MDE1463872.1 arginine N-succinyltransferase [Spartinivicinus sp. A2-2]
MLIVRPVTHNDLPALERLAIICGGRLTTLPANRDHLSSIISSTQRSLKQLNHEPGGESFHFVLENQATQEIIGVSGIEAAIGLKWPFYNYRISSVVHASPELQIHNRIPALHLCQDYAGSTRLCTLFIDPQCQREHHYQLLSKARLLFINLALSRFAERTIVELQGVLDKEGKSPFWECLGKHFFSMDIAKAIYLVGINSNAFIATLMPQYPVYAPLLSKEAQAILGKPREDVTFNMELLKQEGFQHRGYIDIFDAGPTLEADTKKLKTISHSQQCQPVIGEKANIEPSIDQWYLVSNQLQPQYRCMLIPFNPDQPVLSEAEASALLLSKGDHIQYSPVQLSTPN